MADLIDRNTFILLLKTRRAEAYLSELDDCDTEEEKCRINDEMYYSTQSFIDVMKCQPVVDAVPVVRCRDCKYFELNHFEKINDFPIPIIISHEICTKWSEGCKTSSEGYCFMGERKDCK